jgi:hypothetical protein
LKNEYKPLKIVGAMFLMVGVIAIGLGFLLLFIGAVGRHGEAVFGIWMAGCGLGLLLTGALADLLVGIAIELGGIHHALERLAEREASM